MKPWRIVVLLVVAAIAVGLIDGYLSVARAYDLNNATLSLAAQDALRLSKYQFPKELRVHTVVRVVPDGTVSRMDGCRNCGPRAYYVPEAPQPTVEYFFIELGVLSLPDVDGHALMVHEVVHMLQFHAGAEWNTCAAEQEAVAVQNQYLAEQGMPPLPVFHPECGPQPISAQR